MSTFAEIAEKARAYHTGQPNNVGIMQTLQLVEELANESVYVHARIDALQRETAYALAQLSPGEDGCMDSGTFHSYLDTFKEGDRQARIQLEREAARKDDDG